MFVASQMASRPMLGNAPVKVYSRHNYNNDSPNDEYRGEYR